MLMSTCTMISSCAMDLLLRAKRYEAHRTFHVAHLRNFPPMKVWRAHNRQYRYYAGLTGGSNRENEASRKMGTAHIVDCVTADLFGKKHPISVLGPSKLRLRVCFNYSREDYYGSKLAELYKEIHSAKKIEREISLA